MKRKSLNLRPHQKDAVAKNVAAFTDGARRITNVMACGTGKTRVGLATIRRMRPRRAVCLFPSLALIEQTLAEWRAVGELGPYAVVCSDESVDQAVRDGSVSNVTNDQREIARAVRAGRTIFCTYQSSALLGGLAFDFGLFDEAHKTAGRIDKQFAFALDDTNVKIRRRLFMTATPRVTRSDLSMDDEDVYGPVAYRLSFSEAKRRGLICGYRVVLLGVRGDEIMGEAPNPERVAAIALRKAIKQYGVKKIVTFHNTTADAESFARDCGVTGAVTYFFSGKQSASARAEMKRSFAASRLGVASNARVLTEGVDVPAIDMVVFVHPKSSEVDIGQAVGRAMRPHGAKECGYVLIPVFVPSGSRESDEEIVRGSRYKHVWSIVSTLQDHDDALDARVRDQARAIGKGRCVGEARERITDLVETVDLHIDEDRLELICVDRLADSFDVMLGKDRAWRLEHGRAPRSGDDPRILNWEIGFRKAHSGAGGYLLTPDRAAALEALPYGFAWGIRRQRDLHLLPEVLNPNLSNEEVAEITGRSASSIGKYRRNHGIRITPATLSRVFSAMNRRRYDATARRVVLIETGEVFANATTADRSIGKPQGTVARWILRGTGMRFRYLDEPMAAE